MTLTDFRLRGLMSLKPMSPTSSLTNEPAPVEYRYIVISLVFHAPVPSYFTSKMEPCMLGYKQHAINIKY